MERFKKAVSLIMVFVLLTGIFAPACYAFNISPVFDFAYEPATGYDIDEGLAIYGVYEGVEGEITIPDEIGGEKVVEIESLDYLDENGYFTSEESTGLITKINIPEHVEKIARDIYSENAPYFVVDEDNQYYSSENGFLFDEDKTTIYSYPAISENKTYTIPADVTEIVNFSSDYNPCFEVEEGNKYFSAVNGVLFDKYGYTLYSCPSLSGIKEYTVPESVIQIDRYAFRNNNTIEKVILNDHIYWICNEAFYECRNLELDIPAEEELELGEISGIKSISIDEGVADYSSQDNVVFNKDKTEALFYAGCTDSPVYVTMPDTVEKIDYWAFYDRNVYITAIPESLEYFDGSFMNGPEVRELYIPASVKSLEIRSEDYINLEKITVDEKNENYSSEDGVLYSKDKTEIIKYPAAKQDYSYRISENIEYIHSDAFTHLSGLKEIIVPENIPEAGSKAFGDDSYSESSPEKVIYEGTLDEWMNYYGTDFYLCSYYSRPLCAAGNLYIGGEPVVDVTLDCEAVNVFALAGCTSLRSVTLTDNVRKICHGAFYKCTNLGTVRFGKGLESIDRVAFRYCTSLKKVDIDSELTEIGDAAFSYCTSLENTNIISRSYKIMLDRYLDIFYGCTSLNPLVRFQYNCLRYYYAFQHSYLYSIISGFFSKSDSETSGSTLPETDLLTILYDAGTDYENYIAEYDHYYNLYGETYYTIWDEYGGGGSSSALSWLINTIAKRFRKK